MNPIAAVVYQISCASKQWTQAATKAYQHTGMLTTHSRNDKVISFDMFTNIVFHIGSNSINPYQYVMWDLQLWDIQIGSQNNQ